MLTLNHSCFSQRLYVMLGYAYGERSQGVKAEDCGSSIRGFESHRSPLQSMVCECIPNMGYMQKDLGISESENV